MTDIKDPEAGLNATNEEVDTRPEVADTVDKTIDVTSKDLGYELETPNDSVVSNIAERLGQESNVTNVSETKNVAEPAQTMPFDLSKLSVEQIQQLQTILAVTPESVKKRVIKPVTQVREINGKYLIDAKKSFMKLKRNTVEGRDELAHYILVKFYGDADFTEMDYKEVLNATRVKCEILSTRTVDDSYIEGEPVIHRETGRLTEREVKITTPYYLIKLPTGDTVEIKGEMSNF